MAKWTTLDAAASLFDLGVFGRGFRPSDAHLREVASRIEVAGRAWAQGEMGDAIREAVLEEREACAKLAEKEYELNYGYTRGLPEIHADIRARGNDGTTKDGAGEQGVSGSDGSSSRHASAAEGPA